MTIAELKKKIENLPDDMEVVVFSYNWNGWDGTFDDAMVEIIKPYGDTEVLLIR